MTGGADVLGALPVEQVSGIIEQSPSAYVQDELPRPQRLFRAAHDRSDPSRDPAGAGPQGGDPGSRREAADPLGARAAAVSDRDPARALRAGAPPLPAAGHEHVPLRARRV